jgi:hypothetical protein
VGISESEWGKIMDIQVTEQFIRQYKRTNDQARVRNTLRDVRNRIQSSENWIRSFEQITTCAIRPTFRAKLSKGDRILFNHKPPLLVLDMGQHDPTYDRWNVGHTSATVQVARAEALAEVPNWLKTIFAEQG